MSAVARRDGGSAPELAGQGRHPVSGTIAHAFLSETPAGDRGDAGRLDGSLCRTTAALVAFRRGELRPGESRIADRINIDFGLAPERISELKPTQNSLPVQGFTTVIANFNGIFTYVEPVSDTALGTQAFVFDTEPMRWKVLWTNRDVYFPNSMLAIGATGSTRPVIYGIGLRGMDISDATSRRRLRFRQPSCPGAPVWPLEAISLSDGRSIAQWDIGTGAKWNLNGSGTQIGPDREILTSGSQGVYRLKPAE
ncbi:hypothetical protein GC169_13750 [bacterium]|nr:hypothetical protein [bacterium]